MGIEGGGGGNGDNKKDRIPMNPPANEDIPESSPEFPAYSDSIQAKNQPEIIADVEQDEKVTRGLLDKSPTDVGTLETARSLLLSFITKEKHVGILTDDLLKGALGADKLQSELLSYETDVHEIADLQSKGSTVEATRRLEELRQGIASVCDRYFEAIKKAYSGQ